MSGQSFGRELANEISTRRRRGSSGGRGAGTPCTRSHQAKQAATRHSTDSATNCKRAGHSTGGEGRAHDTHARQSGHQKNIHIFKSVSMCGWQTANAEALKEFNTPHHELGSEFTLRHMTVADVVINSMVLQSHKEKLPVISTQNCPGHPSISKKTVWPFKPHPSPLVIHVTNRHFAILQCSGVWSLLFPTLILVSQ